MNVFNFKFNPIPVFACHIIAGMLLASCTKIAEDAPSASPPSPPLASDVTISFPAAQMKIYQNRTLVASEDTGAGKKTATLKTGSSSEISIAYTIAAGETVYNVVAEKNNGGGGGKEISFIPFNNSTAVKYILKEDTDFSVKTLTAKADEQFQNTSVFSTGKYAPATTPYKVRINLVGNSSDIFDVVQHWSTSGSNQRKDGYVFSKNTSGEKSLNTFLQETKDTDVSNTYSPHVAIMNFGQAEAKAETFDAATFEREYKALVSYVKSIKNSTRTNFTPKVVLMSLSPSVAGQNTAKATAVNNSIKKVASETGSVFFDIAGITKQAENVYNTKRKAALERADTLNAQSGTSGQFAETCTQANCKLHSASDGKTNYTNRKLAEELFFSFYFDIEEIATPNQNVSTTPMWKWNKTEATANANGNGNQDFTKRTLIANIKSKGTSAYPQVIFTGDSITDFFDGSSYVPAVASFWNTNIGYNDNGEIGTGTSTKYRALNLGNSGDFTQSLLYRWQNISGDTASGAYTGAFDFSNSVKVISMLIGTNNIAPNVISSGSPADSKPQERPLSAAETVKGQEEVLKILKAKFPNAKILLMAVYPRGTNNPYNQFVDFTRLQVMAINRMLYNKYGSGQDANVIFVDTYEDYLKDCGCQFANYFCVTGTNIAGDNVHLNNIGYEKIWFPTVQPIFDKYVK